MADWEGNFIKRLKLTPRVLYVTVDVENHKIYGINEVNESGSVFVYDLD
jgi:hypothetical protein